MGGNQQTRDPNWFRNTHTHHTCPLLTPPAHHTHTIQAMEGAPKPISSHLSLRGPSFLDIQSPKVWENPSITGFLFSQFQNRGLWDLWPGGHPAHQPTLCLQHKSSRLTVPCPLATPSATWACPVPGSEPRDSQEHVADPTPPPAPPRHPAHWLQPLDLP